VARGLARVDRSGPKRRRSRDWGVSGIIDDTYGEFPPNGERGAVGRKRAYGYTLVSWEADHPPLHVYMFDRRDQELGRWDVEGQRKMDEFDMTRNLRKALRKFGYLKEDL
jgi:hypothetical protein